MTATATASLLKKYDVPGPRDTSYPTILNWDNTPTESEWLASVRCSLADAERSGQGAAIYVHIPFCRSLCTYCGCNTRTTQDSFAGRQYVEALLEEWRLYITRLALSGRFPLADLHLGGGTPTYLTAAELETLLAGLLGESRRTNRSEFSVEADPRVTTAEQLSTLHDFGFRRLSLGIQDFDPLVQIAVNRAQSEEQVRAATETARKLGYASINFDLIYGLPFQTLRSIEQTIGAVMRLRPDRIAFYSYAHVPWVKPGQRHFTEADLPSGEEKRRLYECGRELLESAGYAEIGMDHFALPDDSLSVAARDGTLHRNFMGYTSRLVSPLIGLGASSISDSWDQFIQNEKTVEQYEARIACAEIPILRGHILTREDLVLRRHVLNLMTRFETNWDEPAVHTPCLDTVHDRLSELVADGLAECGNRWCRVTASGRTFLRNICMAFDARNAGNDEGLKPFSRTI